LAKIENKILNERTVHIKASLFKNREKITTKTKQNKKKSKQNLKSKHN